MAISPYNLALSAQGRLSWLRIAIIAITLIVVGSVMYQTVGDREAYPGIDLRAKIVGARLLIRGMNPYYDLRREHHPDHLRTLNENTYSPALLLLYAPLCELGWNAQRTIYFALDWAAILLCYFILARTLPQEVSRIALWTAFVFLFIASFGFRLHLERGQYYVELALLTALSARHLLRNSDSWLHSLPLGLLVLLRPTYAICILCALLLRRYRSAAYAIGICMVLFSAALPITGLRIWKNYFMEIRANQLESVDAAYGLSHPAPIADTMTIEGIDYSKFLTYPGFLVDRTLVGVAHSSVSPALARIVHTIAPSSVKFLQLNTACLLLMCGFDLMVLLGFWRHRAEGSIPIAFVFLAPLNLELFAPQRFAYCDVTILAPALLILAAALKRRDLIGWAFYSATLAIGFALPWMAVHIDRHVPLCSFLGYIGILVLLNAACVLDAWYPLLLVMHDRNDMNRMAAGQ